MRLVECLKTTLVIEQVTAKDVPNKEIIRPACDVTSLITPDVAPREETGSGRDISTFSYRIDDPEVLHIGCQIDIIVTDNRTPCFPYRPVECRPPSLTYVGMQQFDVG